MNKVLFSKKSDNWSTPLSLYNSFRDMGFIDPCPLNCDVDNLDVDFSYCDLFINPPYSDIKSWVDFAIKNYRTGYTVVLLVPARTDTKWFKKLFDFGCDFNFIHGRLRFGNSKNVAPFPSMLVYLTNDLSTINLVCRSFL